MELLYAALLLHKLGKPVNEEGIKKVLTSAGASVDDTKVKALVSALADVDIEKVIKEAATMPVASAAAQAGPKAEDKKEEKKDEKKAEEAAAGLSSLFG